MIGEKDNMLKAIAKPFGWLLMWLYEFTGNYGWAIILFGVLVNLILLPFMMKSKKSMMRTTRLQPRIAEIQSKHAGNQAKLNEEMARLYREEKINPMSGCLWSLVPFPILIALYQAIRYPITCMMGVAEDLMAEGGAIFSKLTALGYSLANYTTSPNSAYEQIFQSKFIASNFDAFSGLSDKLVAMDYHFLGLDLALVPKWRIWETDFSAGASVWGPAVALFLIPLISAGMSYLSMKISTAMNPQPAANAQTKTTNSTMMLVMPIMSIWICFVMPASLGIYWIVNSVLGIARDVVLTKVYTRKMDKEDADKTAARNAREAELERKRKETERLKAEGTMAQNSNTSKKKLQAGQKQKDAERRAAAAKVEREARRARLGVELPDKPASQVGNRRYARGRAYVESRYIDPETAAAETEAAAAESEFGMSIDEYMTGDPAVEEDVSAAGAEETACLFNSEGAAQPAEAAEAAEPATAAVPAGEETAGGKELPEK